MEILLINHSLYTGGVETLIVRMANWLARSGHGCSILLRDQFDGDLTPLLDLRVRKVVVGNAWDWLAVPIARRAVWNMWALPTPDMIYSFEKNWIVIGPLISALFPEKAPVVTTGAYHLNQFAYEDRPANPGRLMKLLEEIYDRSYPDSHKFYMSEETRIGHELHFARSISNGWIWPLPIEAVSMPLSGNISPRFTIVSIGRLTRFKTYSWYMVPILYRLKERFPNIQWHVYGFGECQHELVETIWKKAIDDGLIVFHGRVKYELIRDVFQNATVFVGMGTTLLEAAAAGVPCIPALVDDETASSWGFIDKMPYYTVGETVPGMNPTAKVEDLIRQVLEASEEEKETIVKAGLTYVEEYSMNRLMYRFLDHMKSLEGGGPKISAWVRVRYLWIRILKLFRNIRLDLSTMGGEPIRHPGGDRLIH
jgi:glycosyltransferase involved in cell wall biosynthesis